MQAEIDSTDVDISVEGNTVSVKIVTSGSEYDKVSTEGKPEAFSGGQGGTVTLPDGSTVTSNVPPELWGQPVPNSAEPPSVWKDNAIKMIQSLLPGQIKDYITGKLGSKIAPVIGQFLSSQLAGGVV